MSRFLANSTEANNSDDRLPAHVEHPPKSFLETCDSSDVSGATVRLLDVNAPVELKNSDDSFHAADAVVAPISSITEASRTHSRFDPISGRWTIFAVSRVDRPSGFQDVPFRENASFACPFCCGNEHETPPSVLEISSHECEVLALDPLPRGSALVNDRWAIRVIPNRYPAVEASLDTADETAMVDYESRSSERNGSLFMCRPIAGGHEVFVESPDHGHSLETLDLSQATMLFHAYQLRMRIWRNNPSIRYLSLFKNLGPAAGASLHHSHSQLIAITELPIAAKSVAARMKHYWAKSGCCLQCDTIRAEIKAKQRVVATTQSLIAYCPFGSHLPRLLRITTRRHLDCFEDLTMDELGELARLVRRTIHWLQAIYPDVAYNYVIHTRPPAISRDDMAHWSLEIFPRITQVAGFEWSSDCMINPILPEDAAAKYRELAKTENPLR